MFKPEGVFISDSDHRRRKGIEYNRKVLSAVILSCYYCSLECSPILTPSKKVSVRLISNHPSPGTQVDNIVFLILHHP